jgi:hypothetical protein
MLTPQLKIIKERLEKMKRYNIDGTESLLAELQQIERLLDEAEEKTSKSLNESRAAIMCRAVTSGPGEYCSCCGKKL